MNKRLGFVLGLSSAFFARTNSFAAIGSDLTGCVQNGVATLKCIPIIFSNIIYWALSLAGIFAVFFIILSGIKFITSGGDPKQVEGARKTMTYAIIGLLVIFFAFAIIKVIASIVNVPCIATWPLNIGSCN